MDGVKFEFNNILKTAQNESKFFKILSSVGIDK